MSRSDARDSRQKKPEVYRDGPVKGSITRVLADSDNSRREENGKPILQAYAQAKHPEHPSRNVSKQVRDLDKEVTGLANTLAANAKGSEIELPKEFANKGVIVREIERKMNEGRPDDDRFTVSVGEKVLSDEVQGNVAERVNGHRARAAAAK